MSDQNPVFLWTATIKKCGRTIFEQDVTVNASILDGDDFTVLIDDIIFPKRFGEPAFNLGDEADAYCQALYSEIKEILEADPVFIEEAHRLAGIVYRGKGIGDPDGRMEAAE